MRIARLKGETTFDFLRLWTLRTLEIVTNMLDVEIFEKQSAATLQKSIHVYSIPKAPRFKNSHKYIGEPSYYMDTCFKPSSRKGVGFGFGNKRQFPEWMERNMKENPAPGAYTYYHNSQDELKAKGPTFGISYRYYSKVTIPKERNTRSMLKPLHMR